MTLETRITDALNAQVEGALPPGELAAVAIRKGRRTRRLRAVSASAVVALVVVTGAVLAAQPGGSHDSLVTPATQLPSAEPTPSLTEEQQRAAQEAQQRAEEERQRQQDLQVAAWVASLPLGPRPTVAWTYGLTFHSPDFDHTFRSGGWLVPLGRGGGGYVVELHSEGDTGAGDPDKRTGVLTPSGFRVIDHGNLSHGLSPDGSLLVSSLLEPDPADAPTGFDVYDTATGRHRAHVNYDYAASSVVAIYPDSVRLSVYHEANSIEELVIWNLSTGHVRALGPAPDSRQPNQVRARPFTFANGVLTELDGAKRELRMEDLPALVVMDAVHESADAVLLVIGGQNTGDLALLRCHFSTQQCERATALGSDRKGDFALDASLR